MLTGVLVNGPFKIFKWLRSGKLKDFSRNWMPSIDVPFFDVAESEVCGFNMLKSVIICNLNLGTYVTRGVFVSVLKTRSVEQRSQFVNPNYCS